jgi:hypothetical protein
MRALILLVSAATILTRPNPACAQSGASLAVGSGTVRFPDGTSLGLISISPAYQVLGPYRQVEAGVTVARLSQDNWYGQGRVGFWAATHPLVARWQLGADLDLNGTALQGIAGTGAGHVTLEALWGGPRWGVAAGPGGATGWVPGTTAPHARLRGWWQSRSGTVGLSGDIEPTRFLGAWYTDVDAGLVLRGPRFDISIWTSGRLSSVYASKLAALASVEWRLSPFLSVEAGGGSVLPDPYQGFPRSSFINAGLRIRLQHRPRRGEFGIRSDRFRVLRRDDTLVVRLRQPGAHTVAIAGDWNAWLPAPLSRLGSDRWEIALPLGPGAYHFTLLVDSSSWAIPDGVPTVPDGMGGRVAILTVPR